MQMEIAQFLEDLPQGDLWVFGYGSLMWSPGFRCIEKQTALVRGYHRALCILSSRYRGTPEKPGLVMGLCSGGSCWGIAFRVPASRVRRVVNILWKREMLNKVYKPTLIPVTVAPGRNSRPKRKDSWPRLASARGHHGYSWRAGGGMRTVE